MEVKEDTLEISFIKDLFVFSDPKQEGSAANIVDEARQTLGVVVKSSDKSIRKELVVVVGQAKLMLDVSSGFFEVERRQSEADGKALIESLIGSKA